MVDSILKSVLEGKASKIAKEQFIEKVSKESRCSKEKLTEVYDQAISKNNSVVYAKSKVYSFIKSNTVKEDLEDSDSDYFTDIDSQSVVFKGYGHLFNYLLNTYVDAFKWYSADIADDGDPPDSYDPMNILDDELMYHADEIERFKGDPEQLKADVLAAAEKQLDAYYDKKRSEYDPRYTESTEAQTYYRIWDGRDKRWASKVSTQRTRLRNRIDKLDNEYGAYRYHLVRVDAEGNKLS